MTDLSRIKAGLEGTGIEIQQMCGLTWTDPDNPEVHFTDGNPAVGELTVPLENGIVVPIPVCESCLALVSTEYKLSI